MASASAELAKVHEQNHSTWWVARFLKSSIGAKYVMAVSGVILVGFVIGHMVGNLLVFRGPEALNNYAHFLKSLGGALWLARGILLVSVLAHIWSGLRLARLNVQARPTRYRVHKNLHTNWFARSMALSGLTLLAFIVYHLLHFTLGLTNPEHYASQDPLGHHDVYHMVISGFSIPAISGVYIIAMALLGMHLSHGASSFFQSLGLNHPKYNGLFQKVGPALGLILFIGNASMPVAVLLGLVK
jgi:succinate dehydrogenase / fumarate reductase, cytochrome b subunit